MSAVQKRVISKQLLSQIHFCRFTYKLIIGLQSKLCFEVCNPLKRLLATLLFSKLSEIKELKLIGREHLDEYSNFVDYKKLLKLVEEYEAKYKRKLALTD